MARMRFTVGAITFCVATMLVAAPAYAEDAAAWRNLAERALGQGPPGTVKLMPSIVDPALSLPPIPRDWAVVGTVLRTYPGGPRGTVTSAQVFVDVPVNSAKAVDSWQELFRSSGWKPLPDFGNPGGFVGNRPRAASFCRSDTTATVSDDSGRTPPTVTVSVSSPVPCAAINAPQVTAIPSMGVLPRLTVPESAIIVMQNSSSTSPLSFTSEITVETPKTVGELRNFIGAQMKADGWKSVESASARTLVSTRWSKRIDGNDAAAYLLISTSPGDNRRLLSITASRHSVTAGIQFTGISPATMAISVPPPPLLTTPPTVSSPVTTRSK